MAIIYVDDGGSDTAPYDTWAKSANALQTALDAWSSGDKIYVHCGSTGPHFETTSGATVVFTSSAADSPEDPIHVFGVDKDNSDAAVSLPTDKTIEVSGSNHDIQHNLSIVVSGLYYYVTDTGRNVTNSSTAVMGEFNNCRFRCGDGTASDMSNGSRDSSWRYTNCIIDIGDDLDCSGNNEFLGCVITIGLSPNILMGGDLRTAKFIDCDFSGNTSGDTIVGVSTNRIFNMEFLNCDMPATWVAYTFLIQDQLSKITFDNCDDSNDYPRTEHYVKGGDVKTDTGVYITSGGWADETGVVSGSAVPLSHKITPSVDCTMGVSVESIPLVAYVDATGSTTFTVELIDDFETALQDDEVWLDISYLGTSGQTAHTVATTQVFAGDTPANLSAGTGTGNWTGEPASSRSVKLSSTVTIGNIGFYEARVRLGKYEANGADTNPGAALYVAPLVTVS